MAIVISELYIALKSAGAQEHLARKAAEVMADYNSRVANVGDRFARIKSDLTLLKWMAGFNLAMTIGILVLVWRH